MPSQGLSQLHPRNLDRPRADSPMPPGFFRCLHGRTVGRGELRLAAAILEDAIHSFQRNRGAVEFHRRLLYWEVEQWFASRDLAPVFSFERVCSVLGLNADDIRRLLQRWAEKRQDGPVPALLEWTQPRPKRRRLQLVVRAQFRSPRKTPTMPGAKSLAPHRENLHTRETIVPPGSRTARTS
jgi:hypothetical protein